jgi:hypothetical protein
MSNLEREERRQNRRESESSNSTSKLSTSDLYSFEKIKNLAPFVQQLLKELSLKYAKIKCSISNIEEKIYVLDQHRLQGSLPNNMKFQQKFVNNLEDMNTKTSIVNHLLQVETSKLTELKQDLQGKYDDMITELETYMNEGTTYHKHQAQIKSLLNMMLENQYHMMQLKMHKDKQKKEEKARKFAEKKEREEALVEVSNKEISKIVKELASLKIAQNQMRKSAKNVQGKARAQTKKNPTLPKTNSSGEKKVKEKQSKGSNTNGKKKGTSIKRQY